MPPELLGPKHINDMIKIYDIIIKPHQARRISSLSNQAPEKKKGCLGPVDEF